MSTRQVNTKEMKGLIKQSGLTLKELAAEIGVSESILSKLSRGVYNSLPKEDRQTKICEYFGVERDILFPLLAQGSLRAS